MTDERPLRARLVTESASRWLEPLRELLGPGIAADDGAARGPFVPVLVADSVAPAGLAAARALCKRGAPGRGVLIGGTRNKDALLPAINELHVFRAIPDSSDPRLIADAIRAAHRHLCEELDLGRQSQLLWTQTARLDQAVTELRKARSRLLHTERLSTLGRIAGGLIESARRHQQAIDDFASRVQSTETDPELLQLLRFATEGTRSIGTLLDEIQSYAQDRQQAYEMRPEPLDDLVEHAAAFSRFDTQAKIRNVTVATTSGATVVANRYRMYQVLLNLIRNAVQATEPGDAIHVATLRAGDHAHIDVRDEGCGMPEEVRTRIFDPFFSTKGDRGLGLGLRITQATIEHHGGAIACTSEPGRGTTFRITLPCAN